MTACGSRTGRAARAGAHLFVKAVELIERDRNDGEESPQPYRDRLSTRAAWDMRCAFFELAKDISDWSVHREIADNLGIDYGLVEERIQSSEAIANLVADYELCHKHGVVVSPTLIMNEGRQKLTGNVGYRLIEANVEELLRSPSEAEASWC